MSRDYDHVNAGERKSRPSTTGAKGECRREENGSESEDHSLLSPSPPASLAVPGKRRLHVTVTGYRRQRETRV